jgi:hypothetical protein
MERDNESKQKLLTEYRFGTMFSLTDPNARNTIEHFIVLCYEVRDFMKDFHKGDVDHKEILKRLNQEFKGYLIPLKQAYYSDIYKKLFRKIFIKNILSWILFSIEICGKRNTYKILKNNNKLSPFILSIFIIKILVLMSPQAVINSIKKIKRIFNF